MGVATRHLRRAAPVVASGAVVLTLVACLVIAKANNVYTGGLTWPYFSDLGRDSPGYDVFCVGLTVVAIALCATWYFNYKFQSSALRLPTLLGYVSPFVQWTARACTVTGIISTIGLPTLAFFSTSSYPSLHNNAAYWFFLLETVAIFLNTYVSYKLVESAKCLERDLGQVYCHLTMKHDGVFTKLWNYEQDYSATQMSAAAQLGCILTLVGYSISFLTHNVEVLAKDRDRVATFEASGMQTNHAHFCAIPLLMSPERPSEIRESTDFINV
ncbi:hypothetical protein PR003_g6356 [Phytophthora rubi]|uniref:CWH43-like N-terminal domain-containing protein n=1 Tax=Phytophthora rubi TaxID=129364 RepID=A0A6A4FH01_9STRA|nr:hypothetical protein PR002_g6378 [Phytophthora rubi]KAE9042377.1 hypothetical protein PR001_g6221 [Phytophthora rubi]KAE9348544.1 hypothetical protein PR003_g6356 [Phytophthora rubi]